MRDVFDRRNLVYGDYSIVFQFLTPPYLIIALGDYHDGPLLDLTTFSFISDEIFFAPVYNKNQLKRAIREGIELGLPILLLNINRLFSFRKFSDLNNTLHELLNNYDGQVLITTNELKSKRFPPPPNAPHYIRHLVDVVVFLRRSNHSYVIYVIKHPFIPYSKFVWRFSYGKELPLLSFISPSLS